MTEKDRLLQEIGNLERAIQNLQRQARAAQARTRTLRARKTVFQQRLAAVEEEAVENPNAGLTDRLDDEVEYAQGKKKGTRDDHLQ